MDWTDTHCRAFRRVVAPKALLCTEMVHVSAVIHRDRPRLQGFDASEHPVAPQLGGSDPALPGVAAQVHERGMLERLCRPIARPAVAEKRLSVSTLGRIRFQRKTPRRNDTTHVGFEPIDFIAEPTALRSPARAPHASSRDVRPECPSARAVDAVGSRQAACGRCGIDHNARGRSHAPAAPPFDDLGPNASSACSAST